VKEQCRNAAEMLIGELDK
jgi:hypothetical protein